MHSSQKDALILLSNNPKERVHHSLLIYSSPGDTGAGLWESKNVMSPAFLHLEKEIEQHSLYGMNVYHSTTSIMWSQSRYKRTYKEIHCHTICNWKMETMSICQSRHGSINHARAIPWNTCSPYEGKCGAKPGDGDNMCTVICTHRALVMHELM